MIQPYYKDLTTIGGAGNIVHTGACVIFGVELASSVSAELIVYDDPATTNNPVFELRVTAQTPTDRATIPDRGYFFPHGCFAVMNAGRGRVIWSPA